MTSIVTDARDGGPGGGPVRTDPASSVLQRHKRQYVGYLFVLPLVLLLLVFQFYPIISGFVMSLEKWDGLSEARPFVGFDNYQSLFGDSAFWTSVENALLYGVCVVVIGGTGGLIAALLVNSRPHLSGLFRAIFFLPWMLSPVVFGYLWLWILDPTIGPVNTALGGILGRDVFVTWLGSPGLAFWSVTAVFIWSHWGFGFLIFLSGLQGIPQDLMDAAALDGANGWKRFRNVTWPLLLPITLVVSVVSMLLAMQIFATVLIMTNGGPGYATQVPTVLIYQEAFQYHRVGRAAAISIVFALIMVLLSVGQLMLGRRGSK